MPCHNNKNVSVFAYMVVEAVLEMSPFAISQRALCPSGLAELEKRQSLLHSIRIFFFLLLVKRNGLEQYYSICELLKEVKPASVMSQRAMALP